MAVDTAERRYSAVNPSLPWWGSVIPDGAIASADRRARLRMYSGLAAGNAYSITADAGSFVMTGNDATLTPTTNINTAQKRFAAINVGIPWRGLNTYPTGTIGRTQRGTVKNFYIPYQVGASYTITCTSGTFVWDGEPAFSDFEVTAESGSFAMTGNDAILLATRTAFLSAGTFVMTGNDANLRYFTERTLTATSGVFVMTGSDATFSRPRGMEAESGQFVMVGSDATLVYTNDTGQQFEGTTDKKKGGRPRRRSKYQVEVDGEVFHADSKEEIEDILEQLRQIAEEKAKTAIERAQKAEKRPVRKVMADAKKTLVVPEISTKETIPAAIVDTVKEIENTYLDALRTIEIIALMRKQQEDEEEALLIAML